MATAYLMSAPASTDHPASMTQSAATTPLSGDAYDERLRRADMAIGYRIMREIEVAPGWWGIAREIGETVSAQVANEYCDEQNAVTMDLNRAKRHRYTVDPIYPERDGGMTPSIAPASAPQSANDTAAHEASSFVRTNRAAVRTRICQDIIVELSAMDARSMSPADTDRLASAQAELDKLTAGSIR